MAHNMKYLKERLDGIVSEWRDFGFQVDASSDKLSESLEIKNRETFAEINLTHKSKIVGRDEEKEKIVNFLLQKNVGDDISTIPIVGLGGLGKTTLAQLVFNDESIESAFDIRAWVYVSMNFDLFNIGKAILSHTEMGGQNHENLQSVIRRLKSALADKRFLIVLDDLWEEDGQKLESLNLMLKSGKHGSKVIVTTRSQRVAQLMSLTNAMVHSLEGLSHEDCWTIFSQRAFVFGDKVDSSLVKVGREITRKCKGVPLAAIALGYILRSKKDTAVWSAVRDSEFWEFEDDGVLLSLKLSYYHLPPPLKLCFAYCAVFSKGSDIDKNKLIQQWIGLEFIQNTNRNFTPEKIGEEYVNILLGMSFLQYSPNYDGSQNLLCMHDLVHDLAKSIVGDEMMFLDARKKIVGNRNPVSHYIYYSLLANYDNMQASPDWKVLPDRIRALHFTNCTRMLFPDKVLQIQLIKYFYSPKLIVIFCK
jgi:Holliday junction resolvasome RuvABC ATP-dependent DNA helicase subunit